MPSLTESTTPALYWRLLVFSNTNFADPCRLACSVAYIELRGDLPFITVGTLHSSIRKETPAIRAFSASLLRLLGWAETGLSQFALASGALQKVVPVLFATCFATSLRRLPVPHVRGERILREILETYAARFRVYLNDPFGHATATQPLSPSLQLRLGK